MTKVYTEEELQDLPFRDRNLGLEERVEDLLNRLTLEEKFKLSAGRMMWHTKPVRRLGIKSFTMYDGPHGVRPDTMGKKKSTYFPIAICRASTWDPKLSYDFGKAIAEEVREVGAHMLLAPGINIQRENLIHGVQEQMKTRHLKQQKIYSSREKNWQQVNMVFI